MSDPMFEPLEKLNPRLAAMPRYKLQEQIADEIRSQIDMVCSRDDISLADDTRAEISCVSAADIIRNILQEPSDPLDYEN